MAWSVLAAVSALAVLAGGLRTRAVLPACSAAAAVAPPPGGAPRGAFASVLIAPGPLLLGPGGLGVLGDRRVRRRAGGAARRRVRLGADRPGPARAGPGRLAAARRGLDVRPGHVVPSCGAAAWFAGFAGRSARSPAWALRVGCLH